MTRMWVSGRMEPIPSFPHHKNHVYRIQRFFFKDSLASFLLLRKGAIIRETVRDLRLKTFLPRELMIDPTSRCNLRCKGCWAADYDRGYEIPFEKLDEILTESEALGIPDCLMTGGEPLLRKADIIRLCEKHRRTSFGVFTNATLIDADFADEMARLGNLNVYVSIEGWREETDFRRGDGVFDQVVAAMELLKDRGIGFGFSVCYHARNYHTIASDAFLDFLREKGSWFGWLFQYMPVGSGADMSLVLSPEQRVYVADRIEQYSARHKIAIIDFWNNGHRVFGCAAGGTCYLHINAQGDVEPCAFCHYADRNIYSATLMEALNSPFFKRFRAAQPFSDNPLSGCPLVNHPDRLERIVAETGAVSTHQANPETVAELAEKTRPSAVLWQPTADARFAALSGSQKRRYRLFIRFLKLKKKHCR